MGLGVIVHLPPVDQMWVTAVAASAGFPLLHDASPSRRQRHRQRPGGAALVHAAGIADGSTDKRAVSSARAWVSGGGASIRVVCSSFSVAGTSTLGGSGRVSHGPARDRGVGADGASWACAALDESTSASGPAGLERRGDERHGPEETGDGGETEMAMKLNPTLTLAPLRGLIAAVEDAGGWVHPALRVGQRGAVENAGARGLFAAAAVPRGVVLILPDALRITAGAAGGKASLAKVLLLRRRQAETGKVSSAAAALTLIEHSDSHSRVSDGDGDTDGHDDADGDGDAEMCDSRSTEDAFLVSLPADGGGLPLLWTDDEVTALEHPALEAAIRRDKAAARAEWVALGDWDDGDAKLSGEGGSDAESDADGGSRTRGSFTLHDWLWSSATVTSRTFIKTAPSRSHTGVSPGRGSADADARGRNRKKGEGGGGSRSRGKARTRRKNRISEESGIDANMETFSMEPLVDLLNHAPFGAVELAVAARGQGAWGEEGGAQPEEDEEEGEAPLPFVNSLQVTAREVRTGQPASGGGRGDAGRNTLHSYLPPVRGARYHR